jgi:TorA-specific chaperone
MMAEVEASREEVYGMLAELFIRPPNEAVVTSLLGEGHDVNLDVLAAEFTELLRGLRKTSPPPPYESLYREGVILGETTTQVLKSYHAFGIHPTDGLEGEPPDHISLELDFMRHLVALEGDAGSVEELRSILEAEDRFLEDHLCAWVGGLQERIADNDGSGFYSRVASFTSGWVADDLLRVQRRLGEGEVAP